MNKKKHLIFTVTLSTICIIGTGCSYKGNPSENSSTQNVTSATEISAPQTTSYSPTLDIKTPKQDDIEGKKHLGETQTAGKADDNTNWEKLYRNVIANAKEYELDPYNSGAGYFPRVYIGLHDFNGDNVPELIFGDGAAISIFTVENNSLKKITDLTMTEDWDSINGVNYKDNTLLLESAGSDGCGYECFTYKDKYITGFYSDYEPDTASINGKTTSSSEFSKLFDVKSLMKGISLETIDMGDSPEQKAAEINFDDITF